MKDRATATAIEVAARELRKIVLARESGALIGSEDALIGMLGSSRSTVRQVARLLEREGLLRVRRGINGGYFGARPDAGTIEAAVSSYLETLDIDSRDVTLVASALWVEAMRKAASANPVEARALADRLAAKVRAVKSDAPFEKILELELLIQSEIFTLADAAYIRLIFDINVAFTRRRLTEPIADNSSEHHLGFVRAWKDTKLLELSAIGQGDAELAALAGQHGRKIWHRRILRRYAQ